jgi:hypothetical protein
VVIARPAAARVAERVRSIAAAYEPPSFDHVPDPDSALFLCAADHRTGYRRPHLIDGRGPFAGSELLWELGLRANRLRPGLLTATGLERVDAAGVAGIFEVEGETVADPERRGWLEVGDPEAWEVSADNVLMRLALRSGLVNPGDLDEVRAATRRAFKALAAEACLSPPVLDDLLWELGRGDPDLLGRDGGDLREPPRDPDSTWY